MSSKIKMILGTFLVFFLVLGTAVLLNQKRLEGDTAWLDRTHATIHRLQKTYSDLKEIQANYLSFLLTRRPRFDHACRAGLSSLQKELSKNEKSPLEDPLLTNQMVRLNTLIGQRLTAIQEGLDLVANGHPEQALGRIRVRDGRSEDQEVKSLIDQMIGTQIWFLKTHKAFEELNNRKDLAFLFGGGFGAIALFGLAFYLIDRQLREKQKLLASLKSSEEKFRFLAEAANDAFLITDDQGKIIELNVGSQELFGYTIDELIGLSLGVVLETPGKEGEASFPDFLSQTLGTRTLELMGRKKNGSRIPLEGLVSHWASKSGTYYAVILRDITERKFFIKTLLANEHRLFQFLDAIPVAVLVREPSGGVYFTNQKAKELLGIEDREDHKKDRFPQLNEDGFRSHSGEPYPKELLPAMRALSGEKTHQTDLEFHRGKTILSIEAWGTPILNENGLIKFGLSAMIDITGQKKVTESLREREEFFRNLFEEGPIGMILSLHDGTLVNVNRAFADMLGVPKRELLGRTYFEFTLEEDVPVVKALDGKLFARSLPKYQVEKRFRDQKGDVLWCKVSASTILDAQGEPLFRLAIIENITEQKEAQSALLESEQRFRAVNDSSNDPIVSADSFGSIIYFNPAASRVFGFDPKEVQGRNLTSLLTDDSLKGHEEEFRRAFAGGTSPLTARNSEWIGKGRDGREFPVELSLFTWFTDAGVFVTAVLRDITERKQVEELRNDLISVVSHQLKTPVAQINGYIENLLEGLAGDLTQPQREYLTDMRDIGLENYRLISDLLSLSKIERGVLTVDLNPESLRQIVELSIRDYETLIPAKGLEFRVTGPHDDLMVFVDRDKTVETIRNLLNNALKCTDKGFISLNWKNEKDLGSLEITDTGIGMDPDTRKRLFTKSKVLGPEAGRAGAGLGLFIAKSFMDLQNCEITVISEKGNGSTFRIKMPLARP